MRVSSAVSGRAAARRAGLLLATIAMVSACALEPTGRGAPPVTAKPTPSTTSAATDCPPTGVIITAGSIDAAMGLRAMRIDLFNCGTEPYGVQGYPSARVLDDQRRPLEVAVLDGTAAISRIERFDGRPKRVTAAPGQHLEAVVVWRNTVTDTSVPATTGRYLEIAPVSGQPAQTVTPDGGLDLGSTGRLAVSSWISPPAG